MVDRSGILVVLVSGQPPSLFHAGIVPGTVRTEVNDRSVCKHLVVDVGRKLVLWWERVNGLILCK